MNLTYPHPQLLSLRARGERKGIRRGSEIPDADDEQDGGGWQGEIEAACAAGLEQVEGEDADHQERVEAVAAE
jgi:hypothetical protein